MSKPFVNSIVFTDEGYSDVDEMWGDISKTLQILFRQGYKCEIYDDDMNIIVIHYEYSDDGMGGPYLMWLTDEEADLVEQHRNSEEERSTN